MLGLDRAGLAQRDHRPDPDRDAARLRGGLFLLVPLGDIVERRRLIAIQFGGLSVALARSRPGTDGVAGGARLARPRLSATVAQQIVPLAAHLAAPERRGAAVGTILSGILTGILLIRTLAGFVATHGAGGRCSGSACRWRSRPGRS